MRFASIEFNQSNQFKSAPLVWSMLYQLSYNTIQLNQCYSISFRTDQNKIDTIHDLYIAISGIFTGQVIITIHKTTIIHLSGDIAQTKYQKANLLMAIQLS